MEMLFLTIMVSLLTRTVTLDSVTYTILEEEAPGTFVGNIKQDGRLEEEFSQTDYARLTFSIIAPVDNDVMSGDYFTVNNSTGILTVLNPLDRDRQNVCAFRRDCVITFDMAIGPNDLFRVITVHIDVIDINDNSPSFGISQHFLNISEVASIGSMFQLPVVSDQDGGNFGVEKMTLSPVTDQFSVRWTRSQSGQVQPRLELRETLDREAISRYDLTLTASDGGSPAQTGILLIHVDILDANDNIPQFDQAEYEVRVREDIPPGASLLVVHAVDLDYGENGDLKYSLASTTTEQYGSLFHIDEDSGRITIDPNTNIDRERRDMYYLGVVATDQGKDGREASATVTVFVDDVNDNDPVINVRILTESGFLEIAESSDIDTFVALLSIKDDDWGRNADVSCNLNTADFHLVALQPNKYKLVTSVLLDRETQNLYNIDIVCNDHGDRQRSSSEVMTVHVTDINDNAPRFHHGDISAHVTENMQAGILVGEVHASDVDSRNNSKITYSLSNTVSRYVHIDESTGIITTITSLDHETTKEFNIRVIARDHGNPRKSATCTVKVIVDDLNDNAPRFIPAAYTFIVTENEHGSRELGTIKAIDADDFPYNRITYSLVGPNARHFTVNPDNGKVKSAGPVDREDQPVLVVQAVATDVDKRNLIGTANLTVYVGDVNDNSPRIVFPSAHNNTMTIDGPLHTGDIVTQVEAHDDDVGQNADLEYLLRFNKQTDSNILAIDTLTGEITVQGDISDIDYSVVEFAIIVKDNGIPSLVSERNFTVILNASGVAAAQTEAEPTSGINMTIVIIVIATTLVVVAVLTTAIVFVLRKIRRNNKKPKISIEKVDVSYDVEKNAAAMYTGCGCDAEDTKPVVKIFDPKLGRPSDIDRDSCGSGEGSTTDSGRGASEEGEHGDHGVRHNDSSDVKSTPSVFPGADDSIVSNHYDLNTSYSHVTGPRRPPKNKNVTFEDDVTITEIPDTEQFRYGSPYNTCPSISFLDNSSWTEPEVEDASSLNVHTAPRRTVRNVKAKDRNKKLDSLTTGILTNGNPALEHSIDCPQHGINQNHNNFSDSNSLLKYKVHGGADSTGNASEITDATSTTSGSYILDVEDIPCD